MRMLSLIGAVVAAVGLAGCGGDSGSDVAAPATGGAAAVATATDDDAAAASESGDGASGTGTVTIGGKTWQVVADINCLDFGVALGLQGHAADDPQVAVNLDANTDQPEMANADLRDRANNVFWRAGSVYVGMGATIPVTTTGDGVGGGTATFVDVNSGPDFKTAEGSWEFRC